MPKKFSDNLKARTARTIDEIDAALRYVPLKYGEICRFFYDCLHRYDECVTGVQRPPISEQEEAKIDARIRRSGDAQSNFLTEVLLAFLPVQGHADLLLSGCVIETGHSHTGLEDARIIMRSICGDSPWRVSPGPSSDGYLWAAMPLYWEDGPRNGRPVLAGAKLQHVLDRAEAEGWLFSKRATQLDDGRPDGTLCLRFDFARLRVMLENDEILELLRSSDLNYVFDGE